MQPAAPVMTPDDGHILPLRPCNLGDLFTGAGRVLRRAPRALIASGIVAGVIVISVQLAAGPPTTSHERADGSLSTHVHPWGFAAAFAPILASLIMQAVMGQVALSLTAGTLPSERRLYARAIRLLPVLLAFEIVRLVSLVALGLFAGVGIFLFVQWSLASYVLIAEEKNFLDSLRRSADLIRGSWWRVAGLLALLYLITAAGPSVAQNLINIRPENLSDPAWWPGVIVGSLVLIPFSAFGAAFVSLIYVDLRCRQEGLAWKLDAARRGREREPFGPTGVYASLPWKPRTRR